MPIDAVSTTTGTSLTTAPTRSPKQTMDGEMFLQLLVTQLRNQDPSSPMDTNQMIAQQTQLVMMERLTSLDDTGQENFSLQMRSVAAGLIGQEVSYMTPDGADSTGIATSVSFAGPVPQVTIDGVTVPLDAISGITRSTS